MPSSLAEAFFFLDASLPPPPATILLPRTEEGEPRELYEMAKSFHVFSSFLLLLFSLSLSPVALLPPQYWHNTAQVATKLDPSPRGGEEEEGEKIGTRNSANQCVPILSFCLSLSLFSFSAFLALAQRHSGAQTQLSCGRWKKKGKREITFFLVTL